MKKLAQLGLLLALAFSLLPTAKAELLVEPLVGFSFGQFTDNDDDKENMTGGSVGGRLGFTKLGFQLGIDYLRSNLDVKGNDEDLKASEWAGFVGFEFPVLFRVYAGYIFAGSGDIDDAEYTGASGPKFGIGFTGLPFIHLNLEMRKVSYGDVKIGSADEVDTEAGYTSYMFGVSLPLEF